MDVLLVVELPDVVVVLVVDEPLLDVVVVLVVELPLDVVVVLLPEEVPLDVVELPLAVISSLTYPPSSKSDLPERDLGVSTTSSTSWLMSYPHISHKAAISVSFPRML